MQTATRSVLSMVFVFIICTINNGFSQQPFTNGNIVVVRIGDGVTLLAGGGSATATFLDEYNRFGALIQSIALPTVTSGAKKAVTLGGTATSEGYITRSADGLWLALAGYNAAPGTTGINGNASATTNRSIAIINNAAQINSSTSLSDAADGNNIRGAITDGTGVWLTGAAGGIRYTTIGASTSTQLSTTLLNLRAVNIFNNQIYVSSSSGSAIRLGTVGTGQPTTSGQTITNLAGFGPTNSNPNQFFMADLSSSVAGPDVIYVADDNATAGGIIKYSLVGGNWTINNTIGAGTDEYRGITGVVNGNSVTLYAIRKGGSTTAGGGELVSLTDNSGYGANNDGTAQLLATAGTNKAFRGVALAPTLTILPLQLISFISTYSRGQVVNEWITQNENKLDRFELQRSADGITFSSLSANGSLNKIRNIYSFVDPSPLPGAGYYRLKMIDLDGQFTYSKVNSVETGTKAVLKISPNPAKTFVKINYNKVMITGKIIIINSLGITVKQMMLGKSSISSNLDVSALPAGNYFIRSVIDGNNQVIIFEKK